jgi:hypothetical protein
MRGMMRDLEIPDQMWNESSRCCQWSNDATGRDGSSASRTAAMDAIRPRSELNG